jgi:F0F1-type ATP synthase membrane subunit c/vacuolar-type H+-ATPase subunit K
MQDRSTSTGAPQATKKIWFAILFALVVAVGVYGLVAFIIAQNRSAPPPGNNLETLRPILYIAAGVALLSAIGWMHFRTYGKIGDVTALPEPRAPLMSPGQFQTETIIGLALAEACSIFGLVLFFLGVPLVEFARFAAGTILVDVFYFLPKGMKYWAAWEMQQKSRIGTLLP